MSMTDDKYCLEEVSDAKAFKIYYVDSNGDVKGCITTYDMVSFNFLEHRYITETDRTVEETIRRIADMYLQGSKYKDSRIYPKYNTGTGKFSYTCRRGIYNTLDHIVVITHGNTDVEALQNNEALLDKIVELAAKNKQ